MLKQTETKFKHKNVNKRKREREKIISDIQGRKWHHSLYIKSENKMSSSQQKREKKNKKVSFQQKNFTLT